MRNLKKYLAVVVAIAIMMTAMIPAFAADTTADATTIPTDAKICADLGVLKGSGSGVTTEYLAGSVDRMQAALLYLRLKGLEEDALATAADAANFPDADKTNANGKKVMAYLKAHPENGFVGGDSGNFGPKDTMTAQAYYKVLLTALGYAQKTSAGVGDFEYKDTFTFAATKGLSKVATVTDFTRADFATASVEALKATVKGKTKTLVATLVEAGKIDKAAAVAAGLYVDVPATFEVSSVTATNLKEAVVVYNQAVDKTSAEEKGKYSINNDIKIDSVSLADDGVTATIKLIAGDSSTSGAVFGNQKEYKLSITNVKAANGTSTLTSKDIKFTPLDNELPKATEVKALGNKAVKVTFSEPIKAASTTMFKLDDKTYVGSVKTSGNTATLKPYNSSVTLSTGSHKLTVSKVEDFSTLKALEQSIDFDVVEDKTAPQIVEVTATLEKATVKFDEDVDSDSVTRTDFYWMSGSVKKYPDTVEVDGVKVTLNYSSSNPLPAYPTTLYVSGISDYSGNTLSASEVSITAVVDQIRPEVTYIELINDNKAIKVKYSKDVDGAIIGNYSIKDKDAKIVPIKSVAQTTDAKTYEVTLYNAMPSGTNTITITGTQDKTTLHNSMLPYTTTIDAKDSGKPTISSVTGNGTQIIVSFSKEMDVSTLSDLKNYSIKVNGIFRTLPDDTDISVISTGKAVLITLPSEISGKKVELGTGKLVDVIRVFAVKDVAGNYMEADFAKDCPISVGAASLATDYDNDNKGTPAIFDGKDTVKIRFNQSIGQVAKSDFTTAKTAPIKRVDYDNDLVTIVFENELGTSVAGLGLQIASPNSMKTITGNPVNSGAVAIKDKVAPEIGLDLNNKDKSHTILTQAGNTVKITVPFTEELKTLSATALPSVVKLVRDCDNKDISVSDYTIALVKYNGVTNSALEITITNSAILTDDTAFRVQILKNASALITDAADNSYKGDSDSDVFVTDIKAKKEDLVKPKATLTAPKAGDTTLTVSFDETMAGAADIKTVSDLMATLTVNVVAVTGTNAVTWTGNTAVITLNGALAKGDSVAITLKALTDIAGNAVDTTGIITPVVIP